jgi:hypothetical protein
MARRLRISRAVVRADRLSDYLRAADLYRRAAERTGGHFWLFAEDGAVNTYIEFREAADGERLAAIEATANSIDPSLAGALRKCCLSRDALATCREVPAGSGPA